KNAPRIGFCLPRPVAHAVGAQIGQDEAKPLFRQPLGVAELDPVGVRVAEQPMEQHGRPPLAELVPGKTYAVSRVPVGGLYHHHPGILPVAAIHLSTSFSYWSVRYSGGPSVLGQARCMLSAPK